MNRQLAIVKTVLWALVGVLAVVTVARLLRGLGASTDLSDATPWGFWIAFDVMSGVALAAGGFVLAATVYVFGLERYRPFVRPAILTAFLGYLAVAVGLLYDLGLPWHIWHLMIYQQPHSVLFEVGMCVMLYLTVLTLEFLPVVLEHPWLDYALLRKVHKLLKGAVLPLVIAGIVLSTLHQSSLGSLFLITPYRLHALWYSPILWVLFFVSAVGLGLMMVTSESFFSGWLFGHKIPIDRLAGLGRAASVVLFIYIGLRLGDLAVRGVLGTAFDGTWQAYLFLGELLVSALIPATLLLFRRVRESAAGLATCAGMTVVGMIWYRFDVSIVAFRRPEEMPYFPSWMELAVSLGIVGGAILVFIFFVEKLKIYPEEEPVEGTPGVPRASDCSPTSADSLLPDSLSAPRRHSLAALVAAALAVALLPGAVLSGGQPKLTPVSAPRTLNGWKQEREEEAGHTFSVAWPGAPRPAGAQDLPLVVIDGNRDGRLVLFPHDDHVEGMGQEGSCAICHHQNMPFDTNTSCCECHRDMYVSTDVFDHAFHADKLGGNDGCADCHLDPREIKSREKARGCVECHEEMVVERSFVERPSGGMSGLAVGYMDAMHGLCIGCHEQTAEASPLEYGAGFAECGNCHGDVDAVRLDQMRPYPSSLSR